MFRSRFASLAILAAVPCLATATTATDYVIDRFHSIVLHATRVIAFAVDLFVSIAAPARAAQLDPKPQVQLQAAETAMLRQAKRERPQVESRYRMCPSV